MGQIQGMFIVPHPPIIISELGEGREKEAEKTLRGMEGITEKIKEINPDTLVVITPHGEVHHNNLTFLTGEKATGNLAEFGHPEIQLTKDLHTSAIQQLKEVFEKENLPGLFIEGSLDHGALVPLYFIEKERSDAKLIHISIGMLELKRLYDLGARIKDLLEEGDGTYAVVVSGDLSHRLKEDGPYGYDERGPDFDQRIVNAIKRCNVQDIINIPKEIYEPAGECGLRPMVLGFGMLGDGKMTSQVLSYEGPFGVGYMTAWVQKTE